MITNITNTMVERLVATTSGGMTGMVIGFVNLDHTTVTIMYVNIDPYKAIEVLLYGAVGALGGLLVRELWQFVSRKVRDIHMKRKVRLRAQKTKQIKLNI